VPTFSFLTIKAQQVPKDLLRTLDSFMAKVFFMEAADIHELAEIKRRCPVSAPVLEQEGKYYRKLFGLLFHLQEIQIKERDVTVLLLNFQSSTSEFLQQRVQ